MLLWTLMWGGGGAPLSGVKYIVGEIRDLKRRPAVVVNPRGTLFDPKGGKTSFNAGTRVRNLASHGGKLFSEGVLLKKRGIGERRRRSGIEAV